MLNVNIFTESALTCDDENKDVAFPASFLFDIICKRAGLIIEVLLTSDFT